MCNGVTQPSKFTTKNWVVINDDERETFSTYGQIRFNNTMLKSSLRDCSELYVLAKGTITITREWSDVIAI